MIIGIGTDLCDARRIAVTIDRHGERFLNRVYTPAERAKALGTGFRDGVFFRDMGVVNLPSGKPTLKLTGGALKRLQAITPPGCEARIDLALTDEGPYAQAFVIISALPKPAS